MLSNVKSEKDRSKSPKFSSGPNNQKYYDYFSTYIPEVIIKTLINNEKDEKALYFLRNGFLRRYEENGDLLYVEIPQLPKQIIVYRKPNLRQKNPEKISLIKKDLPQIPLLETEDNIQLKYLDLESNLITKIDHLVSLSNLLFLNLYDNQIKEIENLQFAPKLKALMLGKNNISKIKNLECLPNIEVLDLHCNNIKIIENLECLSKLRIINLANNQITSFNELTKNKSLVEINLRKNLIETIPNLTSSFVLLKKMNLGNNKILNANYILEFQKIKLLEELYIEHNPVIDIKEACQKISKLPLQFSDQFQRIYFTNQLNSANDTNKNNNKKPVNNINKDIINNKNGKINNNNNNHVKIINLNDNFKVKK